MLIHKCKQLLHSQSGFSLLEVIFGIVIMAIIMGPIVSSLTMGMKSYQYNMAQNKNVDSARSSLNVIGDELRYATTISVAPNTTFTLPNEDNTQITYTVAGQQRTIYTISGNPLNTNTLVIAYDGAVQKNIAINDIQLITITRDATKNITISVQLNNLSYKNSPSMTSSTTIIMPNM